MAEKAQCTLLLHMQQQSALVIGGAHVRSRWQGGQRTSCPPPRLLPTAIGRQEPGLTRLRYTYTALPEGLIPRFIMRSEGLVETWEQRCLVPGQDWDKTIKRELEEADLILPLWSQ